jgi:hypothetical protein
MFRGVDAYPAEINRLCITESETPMRTRRSRHFPNGMLGHSRREIIQAVEQLEKRLLFAVVTVNGFTELAIQTAINQSHTGDTIYFPAGTYALQDTMNLPGHRTYQGEVNSATGQSEAIFTEPTAPVGVESQVFELDHSDPTNVIFTGLEFDGAGLHLDYVPDHITIEDCTFANQTNAPYLIFTFNLTNSTIENNFFINDFGPECMMMYDQTNVQIVDNYFDHVNEGMHLWFDNPAMNSGINISNNDFHYVSVKAVEIQGTTGNGLTVSNNAISDYDPSLIGLQTFCLSIVPYAHNIVITDNQLQAPSNVPFGIEVAGYGTIVENNSICGTDEGIVLQPPSDDCVIRGNTLSGQRIPIVINSSAPGLTLGPNSFPLTSDCAPLGSPVVPGPPPPPIVPVSTTNNDLPPIMYGAALGTLGSNNLGQVQLTWDELAPAADVAGYDIQRYVYGVDAQFSTILATGAVHTIDLTKTPDVDTFLDTGQPINALIYYRMRSYDPSGNDSAWSDIVVVRTPSSSSSPPVIPAIANSYALVAPQSTDPLAGSDATGNVLGTLGNIKGVFSSVLLS